jgi:SAM-dependent methyltransferase
MATVPGAAAPVLKQRVQRFWDNRPCGTKNTEAAPGTAEFYRSIEAHRYQEEFHIPGVAEFGDHRGERLLEIGGGVGTDGRQFARNGVRYIDLDMSRGSLEMARRGFEVERLPGTFMHGDGENLPFASQAFDVVYSHGVLHHTPNTEQAIGEVWRVLRPGGKAIIMLYARESFNYLAAHVLGRARLELLRRKMGRDAFNAFIGLPADHRGWLSTPVVLNNSTDGVGNPLSKFYSAPELRTLFGRFSQVGLEKHYFPRSKVPMIGPRLPRSVAAWLGKTVGTFWYIKAIK